MIPTKEEMNRALVERHGEEKHRKISESVVAICGLGGLGSNIAVALARAGVGRLILIDHDVVDITNLHRQQYKACQVGEKKPEALVRNLREISPYIELESRAVKLDEHNFMEYLAGADVICEAFDNADSKAMLVNNVLEKMPDKYIVAASGMAGFSSANTIKTRKVSSHFYLCGDGISDIDMGEGLVSSRVMVCAAHQAHMVLRILTRTYEA